MRRQLGWLCVLPVIAALTPQASVYAATPSFASVMQNALSSGESLTTSSGQQITLPPQPLPAQSSAASAGGVQAVSSTPDYPLATWNPANLNNFSWANRPHDYPVQLIVIHDIEGTYATAIADFQDPNFAASADYVVSDAGQITQMVHEHDIAWHAGNWDYNTRSIGIEHEGYAYVLPTWYTTAMYQASAHLIASICSRWGVPMDRNHVIGHYQVPDPNNPGLYGGSDHHTDPGPNWDWTYYMGLAQSYASALPSPPVMGPDPVAVNGFTSASVTWQPAQTCQPTAKPITGYTVTSTPASVTQNLPATATSATFNNLTPGTSYTFTVTATDADGTDSLTTNAVIPGHCGSANLTSAPALSRPYGTTVQFTSSSTGCPNPLYQFWVQLPGSTTWNLGQDYSSSATFNWRTTAPVLGRYYFMARARDSSSAGDTTDTLGPYDTFTTTTFTVTAAACASVTETAAPASPQASGTQVTFTAGATGCPNSLYQFVMRPASQSSWQTVQAYSNSPSYIWNSTGAAPGTVYFGVWARDVTSPAAYDTVTSIPFVVGPAGSCASVSISGSPASPQFSGTHVAFTAVAAGCSHANALYQFVMRPASQSSWQVVQAYSTGASYSWNSTGAAPGTVYFGVWAKDASSPLNYDAVASTPFAVNSASCASVSITASPTSVANGSGTHVTITGAGSGCTNTTPRYQFLIRPASSSTWQVVQGYSTSATYDWNSTGAAAGTVYFGVWAKDASSSAPYDTVASTQVTVS
jgi:N-acetyl-anhydromuramyl-L-alanine amidase AmpD